MSDRSTRPKYSGEPRLWQVMARPKWLGVLVLVLVVAGVFAWLAQWQMSHAIRVDTDRGINSEEALPLSEISKPGELINDDAAGHMVTVTGALTPDEWHVVADRKNDGEQGYWLVGHLVTEPLEVIDGQRGNYALALGWAPDEKAALTAMQKTSDVAQLTQEHTWTARLNPTEPAAQPKPSDPQDRLTTVMPGQFANLWEQPLDGVAGAGFLVAHTDDAMLQQLGLDPIDSIAPTPPEKVNLLNLFYAIEWVVFGGFAVYFWWRLTRDAWEREHEELEQARLARQQAAATEQAESRK